MRAIVSIYLFTKKTTKNGPDIVLHYGSTACEALACLSPLPIASRVETHLSFHVHLSLLLKLSMNCKFCRFIGRHDSTLASTDEVEARAGKSESDILQKNIAYFGLLTHDIGYCIGIALSADDKEYIVFILEPARSAYWILY